MSEQPEKLEKGENPEEGYPLIDESCRTPAQNNQLLENIEEGYALAPSPPPAKRPPLNIQPMQFSQEYSFGSAGEPPFQYTLLDLFALMTAVAAFMSILSLIPSGFALNTVAGAAGVGAVISLILLIVWPPEQPLLRLGWWVLFSLYLLACIGAVIVTFKAPG
jgi:hypothetical protein